MRFVDLFAGIGGFALGLQRAGFTPVLFCEIDPLCRSILARHWPSVPIHDDVCTLALPRGFAECICGGFPCQPHSTAARGRNVARDYWPEFMRAVRSVRPSWVIAENVPGIGVRGIERVCSDLEAEGYSVWPFDLDTALPARQRARNRIIWLAHADGESESRRAVDARTLAGVRALPQRSEAHDAPPLGMDDELPGRMDRLAMLGNAISPHAAEAIGHAIRRVA